VSTLDELLGSYLDLARHLNPLRHPHEAPADVHSRLGRFDVPWLTAQAAALKSITHAIEDLDEVESRDDEVDRTMLINTVRGDLMWLDGAVAESADPGLPLRHASAALGVLLGEDFDAAAATALTARIAELADFLAALREDARPAPPFLVDAAERTLDTLVECLDAASERVDDAAVPAAAAALEAHRTWLAEPARVADGELGLGADGVQARLTLLTTEPAGLKGTARILELRRTGVERSLVSAADELGHGDDWRRAVEALPEIAELDPLDLVDAWEEEWRRVGAECAALGLETFAQGVPPAPMVSDRATLAAWAVRARAAALFETGRAGQRRAVRRLLVAPGLRRGWQRTVAALLRESPVLGTPERRLASAALALRDAVTAEADLALQSRRVPAEALIGWVAEAAALEPHAARETVIAVAGDPLDEVAAALSHEGWQGWFAEDGGEPAAFLGRASRSGGLAVALARWASAA
jgi:hypothetical protein